MSERENRSPPPSSHVTVDQETAVLRERLRAATVARDAARKAILAGSLNLIPDKVFDAIHEASAQPAPTGEMSEEPKRNKTSYVGVPAIFELTMACNVLIRAYGASIYHVGSSLQRPDWRDVDLVMILSDEAFEREFPNAPLHSAAWEHDPKWLVLTVSLSKWLSEKSGVPVDFKFQPRSFANERHDGPRNPIGRYINHAKREDDDDV